MPAREKENSSLQLDVLEGSSKELVGSPIFSRAEIMLAQFGGPAPAEEVFTEVTSGDARTHFQDKGSKVAIEDIDKDANFDPWIKRNEDGQGFLVVDNPGEHGRTRMQIALGQISPVPDELIGPGNLAKELETNFIHQVTAERLEDGVELSVWGDGYEKYLTVDDGQLALGRKPL